jgi:FtsZ-binding cell division protein ZapB
MRFLCCPSSKVVRESIIPTFQIAFFYYVSKLLRDLNTLSIGICADGTHVRGFGVFGAVISVYQWHKGEEDPLGNVLYVYTCRRFNGPLVRTVNKFVKTMQDAHGNRFPPEAGLCFAKILWASNVAPLFLSRPDMFALVFDGASENTGEGGVAARASLSNQNSIFDLTVNKRTAWIHLLDQAGKAGLRQSVHEFFEIPESFEWPKAEQNLGSPLDTSGPVYRDMEVVDALDKYPKNPKFAWLRTDNWIEIVGLKHVPAETPVAFRKHMRIMRQYLVLWYSTVKQAWQREDEPGIKGSWLRFKHRFHVLWGAEVATMTNLNRDMANMNQHMANMNQEVTNRNAQLVQRCGELREEADTWQTLMRRLVTDFATDAQGRDALTRLGLQ